MTLPWWALLPAVAILIMFVLHLDRKFRMMADRAAQLAPLALLADKYLCAQYEMDKTQHATLLHECLHQVMSQPEDSTRKRLSFLMEGGVPDWLKSAKPEASIAGYVNEGMS